MSYTIITRSVPPCAYCDKAKDLLDSKGIEYKMIDLAGRATAVELFKALGYTSVPLILDSNAKVIGGYTELANLLND